MRFYLTLRLVTLKGNNALIVVHRHIRVFNNKHNQDVHWEVGAPIVLCKTCSVLMSVLEQPRVDNSSAGANWEQLVQLV